MAIDRFGLCPNCNENWDSGDILHNINLVDALRVKSHNDKLKIASHFGYNEEEPTNFSRVIVFESPIDSTQRFYQCPDCGHLFDAITEEHFKSKKDVPLVIKDYVDEVVKEEGGEFGD